MKIKGSNIPRNLNPSNPLQQEIKKEKKLTYYVNFDHTLAFYDCWGNMGDAGDPIPEMKKWVLYWISKGIKIKIFTARANKPELIPPIRKWLLLNGFPMLEITAVKNLDCDMIFDNCAREVISNTGIIVDRIGQFKKKK